MCVQLYSPTHWDRCPASQAASRQAARQAASQPGCTQRAERAYGFPSAPDTAALHWAHWADHSGASRSAKPNHCTTDAGCAAGRTGRGPQRPAGLPPIFPLQLPLTPPFLHALLPSSCNLLYTYTSIEPLLPPPPLPFFPRSIHLGATLIRVSLFSILHPPCPSRSPANHSFLLIYWLLSACGRAATVSLCSPLHGFVFPFPSFLLPLSLFLHPLHLTIDAAALKHELEKAGESNLPGEIGFIFSCAHFFFLSLTLFGLYLSFSFIFFCVFAFLCPFYLLCFHSNSPAGEC